MDKFVFKKIRDIGDILTDTFQYIRIHYLTLGKGLLFFVLPIYLINFFVLKDYFGELIQQIFSGNPDAFATLIDWRYFAGIFLGMLGSAALGGVTLTHIQLTEQEESAEPDRILQDLIPSVLNFLALSIILGFILFISAFFFLIPAIFLGIKLSLSAPILILENRSITEAMARSWELTKDYWWNTFGVIVIFYILILIISWAFAIPISIFSILANDTGMETAVNPSVFSNLYLVINGILSAISSLATAIMYIGLSLHFFNLQERKEGVDLRSKIEGLLD